MRKQREIHGLHKTPFYNVYMGMRQRCNDTGYKNYANWGGRGIKVCDRWNNSFLAFVEDMYEPYLQHLKNNAGMRNTQLERIDNSRGYSPENCQWATAQTQSRNRRSNRLITCKGKTKSVADWADVMGVKQRLINVRINRGWSECDAVLTPCGKITENRFITINGVTKTMAEWGRAMGYKKHIIPQRLYAGWSEKDAILGK